MRAFKRPRQVMRAFPRRFRPQTPVQPGPRRQMRLPVQPHLTRRRASTRPIQRRGKREQPTQRRRRHVADLGRRRGEGAGRFVRSRAFRPRRRSTHRLHPCAPPCGANRQETQGCRNGKDRVCECAPTFVENEAGVCVKDNCLLVDCHNGTCINLPNSYQCECDEGYQGQHCDDSDLCPGLDCTPGTCFFNANGEPICDCPTDFFCPAQRGLHQLRTLQRL